MIIKHDLWNLFLRPDDEQSVHYFGRKEKKRSTGVLQSWKDALFIFDSPFNELFTGQSYGLVTCKTAEQYAWGLQSAGKFKNIDPCLFYEILQIPNTKAEDDNKQYNDMMEDALTIAKAHLKPSEHYCMISWDLMNEERIRRILEKHGDNDTFGTLLVYKRTSLGIRHYMYLTKKAYIDVKGRQLYYILDSLTHQ